MYLFGQLWSRWTIAFKVSTPILHVAFSIAQLHGTRIFYTMWMKQLRILERRKDVGKEVDVREMVEDFELEIAQEDVAELTRND